MTIPKEKKEKVEKYLQENEGAISILWGDDSITTFNEEGKAIEVHSGTDPNVQL